MKSALEKLPATSHTSLFDFTVNDIDGKSVPLANYKGRASAFLVVNVACGCGLTQNHYQQLTRLYNEYQPKGLEILAFPCNQFFEQESGS